MECCLVSSVVEDHWLPLPRLCSPPHTLCQDTSSRAADAAPTNTLIPSFPLGTCGNITWMTALYTSSASHTPHWNALLFRERDSRENRVEVSMLKIQEPGSSPAVWAKNSTVLLPSQSALLTKRRERTALPQLMFVFDARRKTER